MVRILMARAEAAGCQMMAAPAKHRARRRVAAVNFLSNISLDGSHRDTKYRIFQKKGLGKSGKKHDDQRHGAGGIQTTEVAVDADVNDENQPPSSTCNGEHQQELTVTSNADVLVAANLFEGNDDRGAPAMSSKRFRAKSFSGERPSTKRRLFHTHSISESSTNVEEITLPWGVGVSGARRRFSSASSSSSQSSNMPLHLPLFLQHHPPRRPPEVRLVSPGQAPWHSIKKDRVVLLSARKVPFLIYSILPYDKNSSASAQRSEKAEPTAGKSSSGAHITTSNNMEAFGLFAQIVPTIDDGQDVSYSQLLVPSRSRVNRKLEGGLQPISESAPSTAGVLHSATKVAVGGVSTGRSISYDPSLLHRAHSVTEKGSHGHHLHRSHSITEKNAGSVVSRLHAAVVSEKEPDPRDMYNANTLDDPELKSGKHRTVMTFPSYMTSVIDYVKPSELKKDLNEKFREKFPFIQISLSKLRSLKRDLHRIGYSKCNTGLWTVAQSYVYFEKIILQGLINKPNRKLCAGACLMLAAKLNDVKGSDLTKLVEEIEDTFRLHRKELLWFEFAILVSLEFSLHIPDAEIYTHYQRLLYTS